MSNFKKMRLVEDNQSINKDLFSQFKTTPNIKRLGTLDQEINNILNSDISEREKAKLYSQTLRKFLIYKQKHQDDEDILKQKELELLTKKFSVLKQPKVYVSRKKLKKKKPKRTLVSTSHPRLLRRTSNKKRKTNAKQTKRKSRNASSSTNPTVSEKSLYDEYLETETPDSPGSTSGWDAFMARKYPI